MEAPLPAANGYKANTTERIGILHVQQRLYPFIDIGSENDAPGVLDGDGHSRTVFQSPYLLCRKLHCDIL
jgi:hypothetical protein